MRHVGEVHHGLLLRPHGSIDLGEEKPTRSRDRTNSSIWENRFSQSYEGRKPPPSAGTLGSLRMPCFAGDQAPHDHLFELHLPNLKKQRSINHASSTRHLGISGYWTFSILFLKRELYVRASAGAARVTRHCLHRSGCPR